MIKKLKSKIRALGIAKVASDLGYKSDVTVWHWISKDRIPPIAQEKVKKYLKGGK